MRKPILFAIKIAFLVLLGFVYAEEANAQNLSNPNVRNHVKLQNAVSFDARMKQNEGFTIQSARRAVKAHKEKAKAARKREAIAAKRDRIYNQIKK
jgi:hypothetical protein